jgi:hypothetical protein
MATPTKPLADNKSDIDKKGWEKIGNIRVSNTLIDLNIVDQLIDKEGDTLFGCFSHYPKPLICVSKEVLLNDQFQFRSTLLHEIIEAIGTITGLDLTEMQVRVLETSLMGVCLDSEEEMRYILFNEQKKKRIVKRRSKK